MNSTRNVEEADNNTVKRRGTHSSSRILIQKAWKDRSDVYFEGTDETPFYTSAMGKVQLLLNGNLLITEPHKGRAFELNKEKEIVWEYYNLVDHNMTATMNEVQRFPYKFKDILENRGVCN